MTRGRGNHHAAGSEGTPIGRRRWVLAGSEGVSIGRRRWVLRIVLPALFLLGLRPVSAAPPTLPDTAYSQLAQAEPAQRLLAVVRCERTERLSPGSRSERAVLHTVVVVAQPGGPANGSAVVLTRYAQGPDPLLRGTTYLVAAVREEYAPAYTLIEASALSAGTLDVALNALAAATKELAGRDPSNGRPHPAAAAVPAVTQAAPVLHVTAAVERGALVVRYTVDNKGPDAIFLADRVYSQASKSFEDDFAHIERDADAGKLTLRRDGWPTTSAQNPMVQRVLSGGRAEGRISVPLLTAPPVSGGEYRPITPLTVRRLALQLGWIPVSVIETGLREPAARTRHDGRDFESIGAQGSAALKLLTGEIAVKPPVTLR